MAERGYNIVGVSKPGDNVADLAQRIAQQHNVQSRGIDMDLAPIWLQMGFARVHATLAKLRGKRPDLTTEWVRRGNYHWEVSPARSVEELGVKLTPFRESLQRTVESFRMS